MSAMREKPKLLFLPSLDPTPGIKPDPSGVNRPLPGRRVRGSPESEGPLRRKIAESHTYNVIIFRRQIQVSIIREKRDVGPIWNPWTSPLFFPGNRIYTLRLTCRRCWFHIHQGPNRSRALDAVSVFNLRPFNHSNVHVAPFTWRICIAAVINGAVNTQYLNFWDDLDGFYCRAAVCLCCWGRNEQSSPWSVKRPFVILCRAEQSSAICQMRGKWMRFANGVGNLKYGGQ